MKFLFGIENSNESENEKLQMNQPVKSLIRTFVQCHNII